MDNQIKIATEADTEESGQQHQQLSSSVRIHGDSIFRRKIRPSRYLKVPVDLLPDSSSKLQQMCKLIMQEASEELTSAAEAVIINKKSSTYFPMHVAAESGKFYELSRILDTGKSPFQTDFKQRTVLHYAVSYGNQQVAINMITLILNCRYFIEADYIFDDAEKSVESDFESKEGFQNNEKQKKEDSSNILKPTNPADQGIRESTEILDYNGNEAEDEGDVLRILIDSQTNQDKIDAALISPKIMQDSNHPSGLPKSVERRCDLVNAQDHMGETALHLAARCGHRKVVHMLLWNSADVNLRSKSGKEPLDLIYKYMPQAMCTIFNSAIQYTSKDKFQDDNPELFLDFGSIIGHNIGNEKGKEYDDSSYKPESTLLAYSQSNSKGKCKEILEHPLVKLFLHFKWKKIRIIFWASIAFHVIWSLTCTGFLVSLYLSQCPYIPVEEVVASRASIFEEFLESNDTKSDSNNVIESEAMTIPDTRIRCLVRSKSVSLFATFSLILSGLMLIKEMYEFMIMSLRSYLRGYENIGQISLIVCMVLSIFPVLNAWVASTNVVILYPWHYKAAAFAVFLAWVLILSQVGKTPRLGIYIEIFAKVMKSFAFFGLTFISLLTAFALSFSILMPQDQAFQSWPLAMCKVLMMMTGELDYEDFFYDHKDHEGEGVGNEDNPFFVISHVFFVTFTLIGTIILFNLLIGLTVSDIQGLQKNAIISGLSSSLERIYIMELFLQRLTKFMKIDGSVFKLHVAKPNKNDGMGLEISMDRIPEHLQAEVSDLANNNLNPNISTEEELPTKDEEIYNSAPTPKDSTSRRQSRTSQYSQISQCMGNRTLLIESVVREVLKQQNEMKQ